MYDAVLTLHSIIRWFVLIVGVAATGKALVGWLNNGPWSNRDNRLGLFFMIGIDVQILLGFILYIFLSPITTNAFSDLATAMANEDSRYFVVDHVLLMVVALALVHAGRIIVRRTAEDHQKHKKAAVLFGLALVATLIAIPWFRPLVRLG